ncbi:uncharacterized protein LOC118466484 [Anopheles albimanus]|nr:uncharacterized protein LOC118466484 [Anopheles albimanus]
MALGESCASNVTSGEDEEEVTIVAASSPKNRKRTLKILPENTSTPYSCVKKSRLQRPGDEAVPKVTFSTSIMRITRGVQTIPPPEMVTRQTQVSVVPKEQCTVAIQTEGSCGVAAIACQTSIDDMVPHEEACVGTSQPYPPEKPPANDVACQTTATTIVPEPEDEPTAEQQALTLMMLATSANERCHQMTIGDEFSDSLTRRDVLRRIAQSYGIDLSSGAERSPLENSKQNNRKKKKKNKDRQHQAIDEVAAREQLLKETCDTMMAQVEEKLSTMIAGHLAMYRRQMVHHRQRYLSWIQEQKTRHSLALRRKPVGKQTAIERSSVPLEEKAVQCDPLPGALSSQGSSQRVTVATQWYRQPITRSKVVKPKAVKAKMDSSKPIKPTISTDSKKTPAGLEQPEPEPEPTSRRRQTLRQTKLPVYVESRPTDGDQRGRKGKHTPEPANQPAVLVATATGDTSTVRKRGQSAKRLPPSPEPEPEHVEETPSEASDECRQDRKHYPYRTPAPVYLSQCSKSTTSSYPTSSQQCNHHHRHHHHAHQHYHPVSCGSDESTPDFSMLLSPLKRMCVGGKRGCTGHCINSLGVLPGSFLPMGSGESIPATPPRPKPTMMYVNRSQPRVLIRTKGSSHVRTREVKSAAEVNVISSQELYTQIGRAVENAFRAKAMPTLATMYGEPFIETFNAIDEEEEEEDEDEENSETPSFAQRKAGQPKPRPQNQFVCSSGKDTAAGGVARAPPRAPFYPGRSPSLSPIIYQDDSDEDGL